MFEATRAGGARAPGATADAVKLAALLGAATLGCGCGALGEALEDVELSLRFGGNVLVAVVIGGLGLLATLACCLDARRGKAPLGGIVASSILALAGVGIAALYVGFRWPSPGEISRSEAAVILASIGPVVSLAARVAAWLFVRRARRLANLALAVIATLIVGGLYTSAVVGAVGASRLPEGVTQIALGGRFGWARFLTGEVAFWGRYQRVTLVPWARGALHLDARGSAGCIVTAAREVVCWSETASKLPDFEKMSGVVDAASVAVAQENACARLRSGDVVCWMLGADHIDPSSRAAMDAVEVVAGAKHFCARRGGGSVLCWGDNESGQLGAGAPEEAGVPASGVRLDNPVTVVGSGDVAGLAAGAEHTCALRRGGDVACWGKNQLGQLGDGTTIPTSVPVRVSGLRDVAQIVGGAYHTCARSRDGAVSCWGSNSSGQIGDATPWSPGQASFRGEGVLVPARAELAGGAATIFASSFETCAALTSGELDCWGHNTSRLLRTDLRIRCGTPEIFGVSMCTPRPSKVELR